MRELTIGVVNSWLEEIGAQGAILARTKQGSSWDNLLEKIRQHDLCEQLVQIDTEKESISINAIRDMDSQVNTTAIQGRKVFAILQAHRLSGPAVNALLKTLEEPPKNVRFILATAWPGRLPATIRSRCQLFDVRQARRETRAFEGFDSWEMLLSNNGSGGLDDASLHKIEEYLDKLMRHEGPSRKVRQGLLRLRDYYKISDSGGNKRMAKDMLLATFNQD